LYILYLFTAITVVLGKLHVDPPGPIVVDVGTTVVILCSSDELTQPNIQWFRLFVPLSFQHRLKDTFTHNVSISPHGEGRIGYKWTNDSAVQLVISSAVKKDSGTYWCVLDGEEMEFRSVTLVVSDPPRLQHNMSGLRLRLCIFVSAGLDVIV